jgi:hypothetical protein
MEAADAGLQFEARGVGVLDDVWAGRAGDARFKRGLKSGVKQTGVVDAGSEAEVVARTPVRAQGGGHGKRGDVRAALDGRQSLCAGKVGGHEQCAKVDRNLQLRLMELVPHVVNLVNFVYSFSIAQGGWSPQVAFARNFQEPSGRGALRSRLRENRLSMPFVRRTQFLPPCFS